MDQPLSLDDDDFEDDPKPSKRPRPNPIENDEEEVDDRPRRHSRNSESMMPAGSVAAVVIVLCMAVGLVVAAVAGIGVLTALKPIKRSGELAGGSPAPESDANGTPPEPDKKPNGETPPVSPMGTNVPEKLPEGVVPVSVAADLV